MKISSLQNARYAYAPKLPGMLRHGIADICVKEGEETQSVADQEKIKALFPNTYGKKEITFEKGQNTSEAKKQVVGVILSGGQAPGGHNVICGLYDALKADELRERALRLQERSDRIDRRRLRDLRRRIHQRVPQHRRIRHHRFRQNEAGDE